jgi:hypothetical protein
MADQCCCGRIKPAPSEPERINDIVHEAYGTEGAFCGPWWKHELRDLRTALTAMERERDEARVRCVGMRGALTTIKKIKPEEVAPGIVTGPLAHFNAAQRIARKALADTGDMAGMVAVKQSGLDNIQRCLDWYAKNPATNEQRLSVALKLMANDIRAMFAASAGESGRG